MKSLTSNIDKKEVELSISRRSIKSYKRLDLCHLLLRLRLHPCDTASQIAVPLGLLHLQSTKLRLELLALVTSKRGLSLVPPELALGFIKAAVL